MTNALDRNRDLFAKYPNFGDRMRARFADLPPEAQAELDLLLATRCPRCGSDALVQKPDSSLKVCAACFSRANREAVARSGWASLPPRLRQLYGWRFDLIDGGQE